MDPAYGLTSLDWSLPDWLAVERGEWTVLIYKIKATRGQKDIPTFVDLLHFIRLLQAFTGCWKPLQLSPGFFRLLQDSAANSEIGRFILAFVSFWRLVEYCNHYLEHDAVFARNLLDSAVIINPMQATTTGWWRHVQPDGGWFRHLKEYVGFEAYACFCRQMQTFHKAACRATGPVQADYIMCRLGIWLPGFW